MNDASFFRSHRLPLALAAREQGYDVQVATHPGPATGRVVEQGLEYHPVPISRQGTGPLGEIRSVVALYRLYRRVRPDLVHHVTIKPVLYGSLAARLSGVPAVVNALTGLGYVFAAEGPRAGMLRGVVGWMLRLAFAHPRSRVIFQNPDDRRRFLQSGFLPSDAAVLIRGSGVDLERFTPQPEPDGVPTVVLASRMLWHKGVGDFVRAAAHLRKEGVPVRFVLVGDTDAGNPTAVPRDQLLAWHESGVVEWWGHQEDMSFVFAQSHVVCLPSTYGEGVPKVLIEAAASGRAIVTTDSPGCREIVRDRHNGLLVPPRDPERLAAAIRELVEFPDRRRMMGERGRALAEAEFSLRRVVAETLDVYRTLLS